VISRHQTAPHPFDVVSNPEFLREGSAIEDTLRPDRIVIGAPSQQVAMPLLELYAPLERPMIITDVHSAEIIKYASNGFLAAKISFINEIANLCELAGGDVTQVMKGMGLDPRIGAAFLSAGLGYGGSCFPKDTDALIQTAAALGYEFRMLRSVVDVNRERVQRFVGLIRKILDPLEGRVIAVLGLAFKAKTDDMREARSVEMIPRLIEAGARVRAYDPVAMDNARRHLPAAVEYCQSSYEAAAGADATVVVTEWNEFKLLNLERLREVMRRPLVFDGRNIYEPERMRRLGFEYHSIGRFHRVPPLRVPARAGIGGRLPRQPLHRVPREHRPPALRARQLHPARRHELHRHRRAGRLRAAFRQPGEPRGLPEPADPHAQGGGAGDPQRAGSGEGQGRPVPAGLDLGGVRRPARPPPARGLLGEREPRGTARRL
jgi:UDPglucose 6-dehydrogenase